MSGSSPPPDATSPGSRLPVRYRLPACPSSRSSRKDSFDSVRAADGDADARLALLADICRLNALVAVKRAGSGHLGSSFSALDIVVHLLYSELNVAELGFDDPDRDVFFSSKGHDVPGLYAALYGLGVLPADRLARLRRLGGLDGHPDVGVPGIEANSGSLGMGISKGRGIAWAKRHAGRDGVVVVMTGDGELQEGQNWEALQAAAHDRLGGLWIVVDRNELQSDKPTEEILALGDLETKLRAFGWEVETCDGHDHAALRDVFARFRAGDEKRRRRSSPTRSRERASRSWSIRRRSRSTEARTAGMRELRTTRPSSARARSSSRGSRRVSRRSGSSRRRTSRWRLRKTDVRDIPRPSKASPRAEREHGLRPSPTSTSSRPTERRSSSSPRRTRTSSSSTRISPRTAACAPSSSPIPIASSSAASPSRTWSRRQRGWRATASLPVVNSFASFLASRANEQIYNQASEKTKVVYALHYAGLIPAGPGKSHQSVRDISLLGALPNMTIVQPANAEETRDARALGGRGGGGERRDPARDRAVAAPHRARRRARAGPRARRCARARTPSCSRTGRSCCTRPSSRRSSSPRAASGSRS